MNLDKLESTIEISDYNFVDCISQKIQLFDIVHLTMGGKHLFHLITNFKKDGKIAESIELQNLNSGKFSTILLKDRAEKLLVITAQMLQHETYGPLLNDTIQKIKNNELTKQKYIKNNTTRSFILYRAATNSENKQISCELSYFKKTAQQYIKAYNARHSMLNNAKYVISKYSLEELDKINSLKIGSYRFSYNYSKSSVYSAFNELKSQVDGNSYYIYTKEGFLKINDITDKLLPKLITYSNNNLSYEFRNDIFDARDRFIFKLDTDWYYLCKLSSFAARQMNLPECSYPEEVYSNNEKIINSINAIGK